MMSHANKLPTRLILIPQSREKGLAQISLFTLGKQGDTNFVGEVPHFVRDDRGLTQARVRFTRP
jgi:hypothetical protein